MNQHSPPTDQDHFEASRRFQEFYQDQLNQVGVRIPAPVLGQTVRDYRRQTLHALQHALLQNHKLNNINFRALKNDSLEVFEPMALQACVTERTNPRNVPSGELKPVKVLDPYGRTQETRFIGSYDPTWDTQESFVKQLGRAGRRVVNFMRSVEPIRR